MPKPTSEQIAEAEKQEEECLLKTQESFRNPTEVPCEVCGKPHPTWYCCDDCNYDMHTCPGCGNPVGHKGVSACSILDKIERGGENVEATG